MWEAVLNILITGINSCFGWFDRFMKAIPGSWDTVFTIMTILLISRFILKPILGSVFSVGSDSARKRKGSVSSEKE